MAATNPTRAEAARLMAHVYALVRACPAGRVTTYSWIAKALGYPRGARMVGWVMNEATADIPAQRVLSSKGELTGSWAFGLPGAMQQLLEAEGVSVNDEHVDLKLFGWDPSQALDAAALRAVLDAAPIPADVSPRLLHLLQTDPASPLRAP